MSFPRYPVYKDSSAAWLGEVPEHWEIRALKHLVQMRSGDAITADRIEQEGAYPVFGGNGIRGFTDVFTHDGEYVLVGRQGALCGNVNYASGRFWASEHAVVCTPRRPLVNRWLGELLRSMNLGQYSMSAAQPGLSVDTLTRLEAPLPPFDEQRAIAAFLDGEIARTDGLVAEQEHLVELLREKRQAVISHAVTTGIDPTVPMKDSGVEWLGEVPEHWMAVRLKHISPAITVGIVVNPSEYITSEGLPFIYGGDIREGVIDWQGSRRITVAASTENAKTQLREGDILTVRVGAPGVTAVVPRECEGGNCASVMLVRRGEFDSRWLCYVMNTRVVRAQVEVVQYGAAQEQFNISHAVNFWVPVPPAAEQSHIVAFLDAETGRIDALITEAERAIALLQERRAALISAAVTGQIDVRGLAPEATA